jgi:hypothetical protein
VDFGIGSQQALLLKAAMGADKAEAAAALEAWWACITDFDQVRGTDSNLFPQLYWNVGSRIRDAALRGRLKGAARHHWVRNQYLVASGGRLLDVLNRAEVPVLLLKGAAIASSMDDDLGLRTMSDCDMLVPKSRALEVIGLLADAQLLEPGKAGRGDLDVVHGITLALRDSRHAAFDLHWRPLRAVGADELAQEMFAAARPVAFAGRPCLVPCPEHLVFHAIVHGLEWSPFPRYDWLVDLIKIQRRTESTFDWRRLTEVALRYRFGFAVGAALAAARDKAGLAIPGDALRILHRPLALLERLEFRARLSRTSTRSVGDEVLLALQAIRRQDRQSLKGPAWGAVPALAASMLGAGSAGRSFIHNDRRERITYLHGWSAPEAGGRWTEGKLVSCALYAQDGTRPASLTLRGHPFAHQATAPHVVDVFAGWRRLGTLRWRRSGAGPVAQEIGLPAAIWRRDTAVLRFHVHRPRSPIETGYNGDTRALGVFVTHLSVDPVLRDVAGKPLDLTRDGADLDVLWHGWSFPEAPGCWTEGKSAVLRWRAARDIAQGAILTLDITGVAPGEDPLRGQVLVDGRFMQAFRCPPAAHGLALSVPLHDPVPANRAIELRLKIDNPRRPVKVNRSDKRRLGLLVSRVSIRSARAQS